MTEELRTKSRFPSGKLSRYRVGLVIEFYKDQFVKALDAEEAKELAENRLRRRRGLWERLGFSIGDIEIVDAEKED
mgnify:FL=1|tara:strand:- start:1896 stop:2123 length:228 start_codon:yes stop_codon:yes gene_type:complete